jgi:hypothetical protein
MTATRPRALSVAEMQAAVDALLRGDFAEPQETRFAARTGPTQQLQPQPQPQSVPAARRGQAGGGRLPGAGCPLPGRVLLVLAGHPSAGASTVALLLGEAAAASGAAVRLIDCADPTRSGIAAASDAELGYHPSGWRRGRRGGLDIDRPVEPFAQLEDLPAPRPVGAPPNRLGVTIVDAGWPTRDVLTADSWLAGLVSTARVLVACRATVPGVRHTEQVLIGLPARAELVAALGPARWPGVVRASCGSQMRALRAGDQVVAVPLDRRLETAGLTASPLPRRLTAAGRNLASRLLNDLPPRARRRSAGRNREGRNPT